MEAMNSGRIDMGVVCSGEWADVRSRTSVVVSLDYR